jgi:hypothetical protein
MYLMPWGEIANPFAVIVALSPLTVQPSSYNGSFAMCSFACEIGFNEGAGKDF